ncbi:TPA: alanine racemase [Streptococcus suis]|nr:alanine racemase [Streptococcus suis]HEL1584976.1 alanine racemase [Streptococcus suis]
MKESKSRPTVAQIQLGHIAHNVRIIREQLPRMTNVYAVVKADAYGHGAVAVSRKLVGQVDGFCVSNFDEALELRQAGIEEPILILGVVPVQVIPTAIELRISLTVTSLEWLVLAEEAGQELDKLSVHLKVDTGMGRLGFCDIQGVNQAIAWLKERGARFDGIFTHFAKADDTDTQQIEKQFALFQSILSGLVQCPSLIHVSNSAASIWHTDKVFNTVRLGNAIYGLNPSGRSLNVPLNLKPALSLTSELIQIKQVPAGTSIGYGETYHSLNQEWIGTVPVGYADGLTRSMQGFSVVVDGQLCEIVGRVSMDQITIRLPQSYPIGTKVTLIGQDGNQVITVQDWADYRQTINYEVVCLLSDRIPREHIH